MTTAIGITIRHITCLINSMQLINGNKWSSLSRICRCNCAKLFCNGNVMRQSPNNRWSECKEQSINFHLPTHYWWYPSRHSFREMIDILGNWGDLFQKNVHENCNIHNTCNWGDLFWKNIHENWFETYNIADLETAWTSRTLHYIVLFFHPAGPALQISWLFVPLIGMYIHSLT